MKRIKQLALILLLTTANFAFAEITQELGERSHEMFTTTGETIKMKYDMQLIISNPDNYMRYESFKLNNVHISLGAADFSGNERVRFVIVRYYRLSYGKTWMWAENIECDARYNTNSEKFECLLKKPLHTNHNREFDVGQRFELALVVDGRWLKNEHYQSNFPLHLN